MSRIEQQLEFLYLSDRHDGSRDENVAEHSWHLTLMMLIFSEYALKGVDLAHVTKLLIVHDLVEIYTGDTIVFTDEAAKSVLRREKDAAKQLFDLLPDDDDQEKDFTTLWREFEARETAEARFAKVVDALHPPLMTWGKGAHGSSHHGLAAERARERKKPYLEPYPELWALLGSTLDDAIKASILTVK